MSENKLPNPESNTKHNASENTSPENTSSEKPSCKTSPHKNLSRKDLCRQLAKPLCFLLLLIMVCSFLAHYLIGSETLEEYAQNNPELAYGTQTAGTTATNSEKSPDGSTSDDASSYNETESVSSGQDVSSSSEAAPSPSEAEDAALSSETALSAAEEDSALSSSEKDVQTGAGNSTTASEKENNDMNPSPNRVTYQPGFYYEPLNDAIKERITGISYPVAESQAVETAVPAVNMIADDITPAVSYDDLRYVRILHYDFNGREREGELICNQAIAQDMVEIFYELYRNDYQIEKICLVDEYSGDDTLSMLDNNTSCFNYRVVDGTDNLSKHAYGLAIDINPFYNPYIVFGKGENGSDYISPAGSEVYADRSRNFAYKIDENDLCYRLFKEHGFTWGGDWNSCKDYQHFQKAIE